jgi:hypothetical protein
MLFRNLRREYQLYLNKSLMFKRYHQKDVVFSSLITFVRASAILDMCC